MAFSQAKNVNKQRKMLRLARKSSDESLRENYYDHLDFFGSESRRPAFLETYLRSDAANISTRSLT
jgi:hypothetical protein